MAKNIRKWLPYSIFILGTAAFFIYYLFPSDAVKNYLTFNLNQSYPEINMTIDHIKPAFPPGLKLYHVKFNRTNNVLLDAEQIKIVPSLWSLFREKKIFFFNVKTHMGTVNGRGEFTKNRPRCFTMIDGKLSGIQLKKNSSIKHIAGRSVSGMLDGNFIYRNNKESGGNIEAKLIISDCEIELSAPVSKLKSILFSKITTDLRIKNQILKVERCILEGDQMDGSISGSVTLKKSPGKSYLKLSGMIKPNRLFFAKLGKDLPENLLPEKLINKNGVRIGIYGTLEKPRFFMK